MPSERQMQIRRAVSLGSCSKYLEKFSAKKEVCIFPRLFAFDLQLLRAYIPSHMFSEYFSRISGRRILYKTSEQLVHENF